LGDGAHPDLHLSLHDALPIFLPAQPMLDGFDVAARMVPAEEVGGDFYDLHASAGGSWVAIGDVSGHGVTSGLIMMMVQSMLAALDRKSTRLNSSHSQISYAVF